MKRRSSSFASNASSEISFNNIHEKRFREASFDSQEDKHESESIIGEESKEEAYGSNTSNNDSTLSSSEIAILLEELRGVPDGIESKLNNQRIRLIIGVMSSWWSASPDLTKTTMLDHAASRWGKCSDGKTIQEKLDNSTLTSVDLRYVYNREIFKRIRLDAVLRQRGLLESTVSNKEGCVEDLAGIGYEHDLGQIQDCIARSYQLLLANLQLRKALDKSIDQGCPTLADPFGYVPYTQGKLNDFQSFIMFLLRQLHDSSFRRYNGAVYEQVMTPTVEGYNKTSGRFSSHAWKRVCDIKEFILEHTKKEDSFSQWQSMTGSNSLERAVTYLTCSKDPEFSELYPNRLWHSFHNGVYHVDSQMFYKYGDPHIPSDMVACKFHDQSFDESILQESWADVQVPFVQKILEYQFSIDGKDESIKDEYTQARILMWIYAFIGRLLYEVGSKDKWQVIPFIVGRAGTGKSLLLKSAGHFFNPEDVETLANNSQRGFGLETLVEKLVWMCLEVKHDFTLDQAQLQSMVSGEPVSIMRKNKTALSIVWKVPGIMAGNEPASWVDNSGSMSRRIVMCFFDRKVTAEMVDPHLDAKIKANIGNFLHKCACAYNAAVNEFGEKDIWSTYTDSDGIVDTILPRYFHSAKMRLQIVTDPLMSFLRTDATIYLTDHFSKGMSWERFKASAANYFLKEGHKGFQWKENKYKAVFEDLGIKKIKIDAKFIADKNSGGDSEIFMDEDGQEYPIGTEWLLGVTEKRERRKHNPHEADI